MQNDSEQSVMFSLAMLTQQAAKEPESKPVDDIAHISAGDVFTPVLATAAPPSEPEVRPHVGRWIAVGVGLVLAVAAPLAVFATRTPARVVAVAPGVASAAITSASTSTSTSTSTIVTVGEVLSSPPAPHVRTSAPVTTHATKVTKAPEAPKCCPGETEMECAMRRSVGKACGA